MSHPIAVAAGLIVLLAFAGPTGVRAEGPQSGPGWSFQLVPYIWLPTIDVTTKYPVFGGGTATTTLSSGPGDYIPKINFGAMLAGEARYDRFSLLTDILYLNVSTTTANIKSFDFGPTDIPVDTTLTTSTSTRLQSTVWTLAGGYTVAEGAWGNVDLIGGLRLLAISETTDFSLSAEIRRPDGSIALGHIGGLSASKSIWDGIGGVRGRLYLGDADWFGGGKFFIPYHFDVGAGGSKLTWQAFGGLGYQANRIGVSVGYRFLSFQQASNSIVPKMALGGPIIVANFKF
jgi:hypothetical protein